MFEERDNFISQLTEFLEKNGIPPVYFSTVIVWTVFVFYSMNFKEWESITPATKRLTLAVTLATVVVSFFCLLKIFKIIDF